MWCDRPNNRHPAGPCRVNADGVHRCVRPYDELMETHRGHVHMCRCPCTWEDEK